MLPNNILILSKEMTNEILLMEMHKNWSSVQVYQATVTTASKVEPIFFHKLSLAFGSFDLFFFLQIQTDIFQEWRRICSQTLTRERHYFLIYREIPILSVTLKYLSDTMIDALCNTEEIPEYIYYLNQYVQHMEKIWWHQRWKIKYWR